VNSWPFLTIGPDMRRQHALALLPPAGGRWQDATIFAEPMLQCDAWTGTALRAAVEYQARHCSRPISISLPTDEKACRELLSLIGAHNPEDLPRHFCRSDNAQLPDVKLPTTVVLPAQRLRHFSDADRLTELLPRRLANFAPRPARLIASAFAELTENSLENAATSPVATIATIAHEREHHALQVVVTDLLDSGPQDDAAADWLHDIATASAGALSAWAGLIRMAEQAELDAELHLAAGPGRLRWQTGGEPEAALGSQIAGFTAAFEVAL
jgi:hypothetical protein